MRLRSSLCALVLAGVAFAGAPASKPARPDKAGFDAGAYLPPKVAFKWEVPKVVSEVPVPATFDTNGIPSRFHAVVVALPLDEAFQHFQKSFLGQGLWVAPPEEQMALGEGQLALTGFDPTSETSYTVFLAAASAKQTQVIMGEAYWKGRTFAPGAAFAPVLPGAEALLTQKLESGQSMSYRVKSTRAAVEEFYQRELKRLGFERQPDGTWTRGDEVIHLVARPSVDPSYLDVALVQLALPSGP